MNGPRIAIIGAGYSGLAAGYELAGNDQSPVIFEAGHVAGGLGHAAL